MVAFALHEVNQGLAGQNIIKVNLGIFTIKIRGWFNLNRITNVGNITNVYG